MSDNVPIGAPLLGIFLGAILLYSLYMNEIEMAKFLVVILAVLTVGTYWIGRHYTHKQ